MSGISTATSKLATRPPAAGSHPPTAAAPPRELVVDIADMKITNDPAAMLITYSLGSCIGVTLWDPVAHVGGMIHYMLPESSLSVEKAKARPAMFADTGVPALFRAAYELGALKTRVIIKVAGGSQLLDDKGILQIGKRNYVMLRKLFWKNGVLIDKEDVGGSISRTLRLYVGSGRVTCKTRTGEAEL